MFVEEQIYISSNIDDLIDSMARRHLAYRRVDVSEKIDRKRRLFDLREQRIDYDERIISVGYLNEYSVEFVAILDSLNTGRTSGNNNRSSRNPVERGLYDEYFYEDHLSLLLKIMF